MAVFPPDKIISEFIPYIQKIIHTEEDEVLLAISEELPRFKTYLDGKQMTAVLPLFVVLLGCEETVVRESTVEGLRKLVPSFTEEQVQKDLIPMVLNISNIEAFQWKVSACYLIRICYPKAGKEKEPDCAGKFRDQPADGKTGKADPAVCAGRQRPYPEERRLRDRFGGSEKDRGKA